LLYEKRFTIEGARKFLESQGRQGGAAAAAKDAKSRRTQMKNVQGDLFGASSPFLAEVRKELREIAEMLK
jgi:hypothetical protein